MLGDWSALATLPVRDLAAAARFYEGTLGLARVSSEGEEAVEYRTGGTRMLVYVSRYAGTNQATAATWMVGDQVDALVRELRSRGVAFEHYDLPDTRREGDVHVAGSIRVAWFKDPDGNIHSLVNG